jgi:hypothetical protein
MNKENPTLEQPTTSEQQPATVTDTIYSSVASEQEAPAQVEAGITGQTDLTTHDTADLEQVTPAGIINQVRKQQLETLFTESINNPRFWENSNRADRLEEALVIPMFDDKSLQQFAVSAEKELIRKAAELAVSNRAVPVMPTDAQIRALALEKAAAKQEKDAAKAAKGAK